MKDQEFLAQRELAAREVARLFNIPPWLLGCSSGDSLTYSNTWQQARHFLDFTLRPHLTRIERSFNSDVSLLPGGAYLAFDGSAYLRLDADARAQFYERGLRDGWLLTNEVRALEDMAPLPENLVAIPTDGRGARNGNGNQVRT
jgi:HK97 family phage portal protein